MGIRSMFSGVSGLQSHSTWLDVIGNNISNTNTVAYKASRVEFADQISQTQFSGTGPSNSSNLGGVNPQQVGLGTRVASIQTLFMQGPTLNTGVSTDIAIVGEGYMISKSGTSTLLTRAGNLDFDGNGNLVDQNGGLIQGWNAKAQFTQRDLDINNNLVITDASLKLDNTNVGQITNIVIQRDFVLPPRATTVAMFSGNLDSFQQAVNNADLGPAAAAILPFANNPLPLNPAYFGGYIATISVPPGQAMQQINNLQDPLLAVLVPEDPQLLALGVSNPPGGQLNVGQPLMFGDQTLATAQGLLTNAWEQNPPVPPHHVINQTVYDSLGNARSLTIQLYQVNDLGTNPTPVNTPPLSQVVYAWYAFDTTNGAAVNNASLIGGTSIDEGSPTNPGAAGASYSRATGDYYYGDFIWFNTDGSLGNMGGVDGTAGTQARPHVYLPPIQDNLSNPTPVSPIPAIGAEITDIVLDFGTPGLLGGPGNPSPGRRDGLYSDAEGSYRFINGVNTYIPNHTGFIKKQDGYTDGQLTGIQFDKTGTIVGSFTNGQNAALAQLAMAMPENQEGLSKVGGNYYATSANTGPMFVGHAMQLGIGSIQGNALEGSNVDLTVELSNMIIAQRGFEVNARVITVTNETLQTVTRLGQ